MSSYPINISPLLAMPVSSPATSIAQSALAHWNAAFDSVSESDVQGDRKGRPYNDTLSGDRFIVGAALASALDEKEAFMTEATWLLHHESRLSNDAGGWPISFPLHTYHAHQPWLSALTQGNVLSVLVRAYQLSNDEAFLQAAQRAVRTFELDILDGGVSTPIGDNGVFFEEVAVYPAAHMLKGAILGLFGLYDYVLLTNESRIEALIQRNLTTLHTLLDAFDTGYWTQCDLLYKRLAPWSVHALHVTLLEALARYSGCSHCATLAARWAEYQRSPECRLRYLIARGTTAFLDDRLKPGLRRLIFPTATIHSDTTSNSELDHLCVPINAFPIPGGMRSVLAGVAQVMGEHWQMTYLAHQKGQAQEDLEIETFGPKVASPWHFPTVSLYSLSGWGKLFTLLRQGADYRLILPQDGVFTGAFAALVGKMAGVRVVCMDHGNMTWLDNPALQIERMNTFHAYPWYRRILARVLLPLYQPSLRLLARIATHCTDQFLVAGDEVEDVYRKRLGVHPSRITRYAYPVDPARFTPPDRTARVRMRAEQGIAEEAIVITLINRLAPEKGLDYALQGIASLPPYVQTRVKVLIVGDGPLRSHIEADIQQLGLDSICTLWGEATPSDVVMLLGLTDIFLYSGTRGTNYSMAVLEAMAAGCAVIASVSPRSNARLLADDRGIAIEPGNATAIGTALVRLCNDETLCRQMGQRAREYVAAYHTPVMLKRSLLRASFFAPTIEVT